MPERCVERYSSPSSLSAGSVLVGDFCPNIDGSLLSFMRSSSKEPRTDSVAPSRSRANLSSNSRRTGSLSILWSGNKSIPLIASNSCTAAVSWLGFNAVTSSTGRVCKADLPKLPRPDCCLFECHHRNSIPRDVLAHTTRAFSCSAEDRQIDNHARPPIVLRGVNCIPVDWLLNRKSQLK